MKEAIARIQIGRKPGKLFRNPLVKVALGSLAFVGTVAAADDGCGGGIEMLPSPRERGIVVEKQYEEAGRGGPMDGYPLYDDEDFIITVEACRGKGEKQSCRRQNYYASKELYNSLNIGDHVNFRGNPDVSETDPMGIKL